MSTGTAVIGGAVQPASSCLMEFFRSWKRKYDRVKRLDENKANLERAEKDLRSKKADVEKEINRDQITKEQTSQCETWLQDVEQTTNKVMNLKFKYDNANKAFCGLRSLFSLSKLSKDMTLLAEQMITLRDRIKLDENVVSDKMVESFVDQCPQSTDKLPSLAQPMDKLLNFLHDKNVKKIGVYGMAGVGKTTIMKNLNNRVSGTGLFGIVIFIPVEVLEVRRIQDMLVERLKLDAEGSISNGAVAYKISRRLENEKYLLILDKVRSTINLEELGIFDNHKHGKVVVAARHKVVCDEIGVQEFIQVERMSSDDALHLFQQIAGDVANHIRIKEVAEQITKECGGLPHVIKIVATILKDEKNESIWWNILSRLRSSKRCYLKNCDDLFGAFEVAYDELEDHMKKCLLYGAMFPGDEEIYDDYLMECWGAEDFIPVVKQERATSRSQLFRMAREEGHYTLKNLTNACLLERCRRVKYVKMPLIFRRWALRIANLALQSPSMVTAFEEIEEHPTEEEWRNARMISLMCSNLSTLPERPECETITSLFLQKNGSLNLIPLQFFDCMSKLLVLDLCFTSIQSLPTSLSKLISLKALYLNDCSQLHGLPTEISNLEHLEVLDTRRSGIHGFPKEIGELAVLKCLRMSFTGHVCSGNNVEGQQVETIPLGVVERLSSLEELTIEVDFNVESWNDVVDTIAREVATLRVLNTLCFYFPKVECFAEFIRNSVSWNNTRWGCSSFRSFKILVGSHETHYRHGIDMSGCRGERHLKFFAGSDSVAEITAVLAQACTFELIGHRTINDLTNLGINNMRGLEACVIQECNQMRSIIDCSNMAGTVLPELMKLHLINLEVLDCIWVGSISPKSLANLTTLTIYGCPQLREILSGNLARHLPRLHLLRVEDCSGSTVVIKEAEITEDVEVLPKLERLELVNLPQLVSICDQNDLLKWISLMEVLIDDCQRLKNLPLMNGNVEQLKLIECRQSWWDTLEMDREVKARLQRNGQFIPLR